MQLFSPPYVDSPRWQMPYPAGWIFGTRKEERFSFHVRLSSAWRHRITNASRHSESRYVKTYLQQSIILKKGVASATFPPQRHDKTGAEDIARENAWAVKNSQALANKRLTSSSTAIIGSSEPQTGRQSRRPVP